MVSGQLRYSTLQKNIYGLFSFFVVVVSRFHIILLREVDEVAAAARQLVRRKRRARERGNEGVGGHEEVRESGSVGILLTLYGRLRDPGCIYPPPLNHPYSACRRNLFIKQFAEQVMREIQYISQTLLASAR